MNYVKVFVLNLCVSISDSMYFQIVIQGVDLSVHTLYVSLGESVLFVSPPPSTLERMPRPSSVFSLVDIQIFFSSMFFQSRNTSNR